MQNTPCDVRPQKLNEPPEQQRRASCPRRSHLWGPELWSSHPSHGWLGLHTVDTRPSTPVQLLRGMATPWDPELTSSQVTPNPERHTEPPQKSCHLAPQLLSPGAWAREATWKQVGKAPPPRQEPHCAAQVGGRPTGGGRQPTRTPSFKSCTWARSPRNICLCNLPDTCPQESQARPEQPENQLHTHRSWGGLGAWACSPPPGGSIAEAAGHWRRVLRGTRAGSSRRGARASGGSSACIWAQVYSRGLGFASPTWFYLCTWFTQHLGFTSGCLVYPRDPSLRLCLVLKSKRWVYLRCPGFTSVLPVLRPGPRFYVFDPGFTSGAQVWVCAPSWFCAPGSWALWLPSPVRGLALVAPECAAWSPRAVCICTL